MKKTNPRRWLMPATVLVGASFMVACEQIRDIVDDAIGTLTVSGKVTDTKGVGLEGATVSYYAVSDMLAAAVQQGTCLVEPRAYVQRMRERSDDAAAAFPGCPIVVIGTSMQDGTYRLIPGNFPNPLARGTTGPDGSYSIVDVSKDAYIVISSKDQYVDGLEGMNGETGQITLQTAIVPANLQATTLSVNLQMAGGPVPAPPPEPRTENVGQAEDVPPAPEPALPEPAPRRESECAMDSDCDTRYGPPPMMPPGAPHQFVWRCEYDAENIGVCVGALVETIVPEDPANPCEGVVCDDGNADTEDVCDSVAGGCVFTATPRPPNPEELTSPPPEAPQAWLSFTATDYGDTQVADATGADFQLALDASEVLTFDPVILVKGQLASPDGSGLAYIRMQTGSASCTNQEPTTEVIAVRVDEAGNIVSEKGPFQEIALTGGYQVIQLASSAEATAAVSNRIVVGTLCRLPANEIFVEVYWDGTPDDVDLHIWNAALETTGANTNRTSSYGAITIDDIDGYGPEAFASNEGVSGGTYQVRLQHYRGPTRPLPARVRVIQTDGVSCLRDETFTVEFSRVREWKDVGNFQPGTICGIAPTPSP